jgi:hypothetical protein
MDKAMIEALNAAHSELLRAELAYCRAAGQYAGFIARHTTDPAERSAWVKTYNDIVEQHRQAQNKAIELGMIAGRSMRRMDDAVSTGDSGGE